MAKQGEERCNDCAGLMRLHPMPDCRSYGHALKGGPGEERAAIEHAYEAGRRHERTCYVEERDRLRDLLSQARIRLDQHLGICACQGEACATICRECRTTQDLVNRIRAFMQGRSQ